MFRRFMVISMIVVGLVLVAGSLLFGFVTYSGGETASLPESIAGVPLRTANYGSQAVAEITRLHQKDLLVTSGAKGLYGYRSQFSLWAAGFSSGAVASQSLNTMTEKISQGNSPFSFTGQKQVAGRTIYELYGMGQKHFYFQSGKLVIWLAADVEMADRALKEVLNYYP